MPSLPFPEKRSMETSAAASRPAHLPHINACSSLRMDLYRYASVDTKYKKEDSGAQEKSFLDPIVLFVYRFNCPLRYLQGDNAMQYAFGVGIVV